MRSYANRFLYNAASAMMHRRHICTIALLLIVLQVFGAHRALVIGIGSYPESSGWASINGDKDIPMVEQILQANGFKASDITTLRNEQATFAAITHELERLASTCNAGDIVYIHFSGHGQQITDVDGDESDGLDEAWVPYDAAFAFQAGTYEGEHHLTDDILNGYLHRIRERVGAKGKIVVVADACHSGNSTRALDDDDEYVVRGAKDAFVIPHPARVAATVSYPIEWTFISACKPSQCNYEYQGSGSLTYAIHQLHQQLHNLSNAQIGAKVRACIQEIIPFNQTPTLEVGEGQADSTFL